MTHPGGRLSRDQARAETRRRLLAAVAEVFAERGFAAATVEQIAEVAGHTKGAVYYNFADKEVLFLELFDQRVAANLEAVRASLDLHEPGPDQNRALNTIEDTRARDPRWGLLMVEFWLYAMRNPTAQARLVEHQRQLQDLVTKIFERQCARYGITPAAPADELAALLLAGDTGLAQLGLTDPDLAPPGLYGRLVGLLRHAAIHGWDQPTDAAR